MSLDTFTAPGGRNRQRTNFEMLSWLFMRASGVLLVFLIIGHLVIMNILDGGVQRINFGFVAGRWASPFWQMWDLLQLWLAIIHGTNGLRTVVSDYASKPRVRFWMHTLVYASSIFVLFAGTLVIFTFDPSIG